MSNIREEIQILKRKLNCLCSTVDKLNQPIVDVKLGNATYNAASNIITLTQTDNSQYNIDLSEFVISTATTPAGILQVMQEGFTKFQISKVGVTGNYNDLSNLPSIPTQQWIVDVNGDYKSSNVNGSVYSLGGGALDGNAAYGALALRHNTSGSSNTAIGYNTMNANTTGFANTVLGHNNLTLNTTSSYNTAIGTSSMSYYNGPVNAQNTAVGAFSMYLSTTGVFNTAIGSSALQNHTTGSNNTAIGYHAIEGRLGSVTGSNNIAIGSQAGRGITSGSSNLLIENASTNGITTGSNNIILNPVNVSGITTGSNNVIIGGFNNILPATLSNHMIFGTGNGVERFRIDNFGNFGIGTTTPNNASIVDINSTTKTLTIPRMNTIQQTAIVTPLAGSMIYNNQTYINSGSFQLRDSLGWFDVAREDIVDLTTNTLWVIPNNVSTFIGNGAGGSTGVNVNSNSLNSYATGNGKITNNSGVTKYYRVSVSIHMGGIIFSSGRISISCVNPADPYGGRTLGTKFFTTSDSSVVGQQINFTGVISLPSFQSFTVNIFHNLGVTLNITGGSQTYVNIHQL